MTRIRYFLCLCTIVALGVVGWSRTSSADPLDTADDARRAGDGAVLARLSDAGASREARLVAIRQALWMQRPERALASLARIAGGRDPVLAPDATFAAYTIALALDPLTLEAHEVAIADLDAAKSELTRLASDTTARPDLRVLARDAAGQIASLSAR